MQRDERGTVQGPVKKQQPDGMSHGGARERNFSTFPVGYEGTVPTTVQGVLLLLYRGCYYYCTGGYYYYCTGGNYYYCTGGYYYYCTGGYYYYCTGGEGAGTWDVTLQELAVCTQSSNFAFGHPFLPMHSALGEILS